MDTDLSRTELQSTLTVLTKLQQRHRIALEAKRAEAVRVTGELAAMAEEGKSLAASIKTVKTKLGLPLGEEEPQSLRGSPGAGEVDVTFEVMLIVAEHHEQGGIDIDGIEAELKARGISISSRDYLNTILTRKKNKQKKLTRIDGKWLLTDKGKAEIKMRSE